MTLPTTTNGAECGALPLPSPSSAFERLLQEAQAQIESLMRLPMYQSDDEEVTRKYRQDLLTERLAKLEASKAEKARQQAEAFNASHSFQ